MELWSSADLSFTFLPSYSAACLSGGQLGLTPGIVSPGNDLPPRHSPGHFRLISLPGYHAVQFPEKTGIDIGPAGTLHPDTATL